MDLSACSSRWSASSSPCSRRNSSPAPWTLPPRMDYPCDPDKLARVFDNLLRNACHYSTPGTEVQIDIRIQISGVETGASIVLTFHNEGRTIPPEKLERIFDQFFRLDSSPRHPHGGARALAWPSPRRLWSSTGGPSPPGAGTTKWSSRSPCPRRGGRGISMDSAALLFAGWKETMIWTCLQGHMGTVVTDGRTPPESALCAVGGFLFSGREARPGAGPPDGPPHSGPPHPGLGACAPVCLW